ncbi:MAG: Ig-like domain-containing protein, partial [Bacteroidia bacterium]
QTICSGSAPGQITGSLPTGGNGLFTYSWLNSNTGSTSGFNVVYGTSTGQNYIPSNNVINSWYRRLVSSGGCKDTSSAVDIIITPAILNNQVGSTQSIFTGTVPAQFTGSIPTGGSGTYAYLWLKSTTSGTAGFIVASGINNTQNYTSPALMVTTWFRRIVISGNCVDTSLAVGVSVNGTFANNIISTPSQNICSGSNPAPLFGTIPTGGILGTNSYLWLSSTTSATTGFSPALGTNNGQNYYPGPLTISTWFSRIVISGLVADTSFAIAVSVTISTPIINNSVSGAQTLCRNAFSAPLNGSIPAGGNGATYLYRWLKSTTSPTSGFTNAGNNDSTLYYQPSALTTTTWFRRAVISGVCAIDTSTNIKITVNPFIFNNSSNGTQNICAGSTPAFIMGSLPTGGNSNYNYTWLNSTVGANSGYSIANGISNGKNYSPVNLTTTTWFRRLVESGGCTDTSTTSVVTVSPVLLSNTISGAQTICSGSIPSYINGSLPSGGNGYYNYLWIHSTADPVNGFSVAGGLNNSQSYSSSPLNTTTWLRRIVSSGGCSDTSSTQEITVKPVLTASLSISSSSTTVCRGGAIRFTAASKQGGTSPSYLWKLNGNDVGTDSVVFMLNTPRDGDSVYAILTSNASPCLLNKTANSNAIKLNNSTVVPTIAITASNTNICIGNPAVFTATATNEGLSPFYQWSVNRVNVGTNSPRFILSSSSGKDTVSVVMMSSVRCVFSPLASSNSIVISVNKQTPLIKTQPVSAGVVSGDSALFTIATSPGSIIQWQQSNNGGAYFSNITDSILFSGINSDSLIVLNTTGLNNSQYRALLTNSCGGLYSNSATLNVNFRPYVQNDTINTKRNKAVTIDPLSNGNSLNQMINIPFIIKSPVHGKASVNADGTVTYIPVYNFSGTDSIKYEICNNGIPVLCDSANIIILIDSGYYGPVAFNDTVTTRRNTPLKLNLNSHYFDNTGILNNPVIIVPPKKGTAVTNTDGSITYSPVFNFGGTDTLCYRVCNNNTPVLCDSAFVFILVDTTNHPPVVFDSTFNIRNDLSFSGNLNYQVTDPDNNIDSSSFGLISTTGSGQLTLLTNGSFTYIPSKDFTGQVSFLFKVCDLGNPVHCGMGFVFINVCNGNFANKPPVANNDSFETQENTEITFDVRANDIDSDGVLGFPLTSSLPAFGNLVMFTDGSYTYSPLKDFIGKDQFTYIICDNGVPSKCDSAMVKIVVKRTVDHRILVPQGFSPDGDGINDFFVIKNVSTLPHNKLTVLNRWGMVVYQKESYNNDWDGKANRGTLQSEGVLPAGTYFYILETGTDEPNITGYIYLTK